MIREESKKIHFFFGIICFMLLALFIWKLPYGIPSYDESFYVSIPYRLSQGDFPVSEEWHMAQFVLILLTPIVKLYTSLMGCTEGIILFLRALWLVLHMFVIIVSYCLMQKQNPRAALFMAVTYGLFIPFLIMSIGYYYVGMMCIYLLTILFYTEKNSVLHNIVKGVLVALLILSQPFAVIIYIGLILYSVISAFQIKKSSQLSLKSLVWMHVGILTVALPIIIYIFMGMEKPAEIIECVKNILADPDHPDKSILNDYIRPIVVYAYRHILWLSGIFIMFILGIVTKKKRLFLPLIFLLCAFFCVYECVWHREAHTSLEDNYQIFPLFFASASAWLYKEEKNKKETICYVILPLLYAVTMMLGSKQNVKVIAVAVLTIASFALFFYGESVHQSTKCGKNILKISICVFIASFVFTNIKYVWYDQYSYNLTATLSDGPAKGVKTHDAYKMNYEQQLFIVNQIESNKIDESKDTNVLFYNMEPMYYLMTKYRNGNISAYNFTLDNLNDKRLANYYSINASKHADIIVAMPEYEFDDNNKEYYQVWAEQNKYAIETYELPYWGEFVVMTK